MHRVNQLSRVLLLFCVSAFVACASKDEPYKVGVLTPLTGQIAFLGDFTRQGLELALERIDSLGGIGGRKLELVFEDTRSNPKDAVTAAIKLINIDKVQVIIGDITSSATQAIAPIAEQHRVVVLANGASAPAIRDAGDYIFRNWNSDDYEGSAMAEFAARRLKYSSVAIVYANEDYSLGLKSAFEVSFIRQGGTIPGSFEYVKDTRDFRTLIGKIPQRVDALYIVGWPVELGNFVKQLRELRRSTPCLSAIGVQSEEFLKIAGSASEGILYTAPAFDAEHAEGVAAEFVQMYTEKFGKLPDVVSAVSYDALMIIADAIRQNGYTSDGIKRALYNTRDFPGASGITTFDNHGDVSKPVAVKRIHGGRFEYYPVGGLM